MPGARTAESPYSKSRPFEASSQKPALCGQDCPRSFLSGRQPLVSVRDIPELHRPQFPL